METTRNIHSNVLRAIFIELRELACQYAERCAEKCTQNCILHSALSFSGVALLGPVKQKFLQVNDVFEPCDSGDLSQLFISKTYDATSHFETACKDVLDVFRRGTGVEFDCSLVKHNLDQE